MAKILADLLIDRLIDWGVDTIFGFPGDGINGIFEALRTRQDRMHFVQVRHEEAAAFAACGYAKFTGKPGVCLATSGPGGIHLLNGLYDAKCDGVPVLAITGHTFHDLIGTHYDDPANVTETFRQAFAVEGPALVEAVVDPNEPAMPGHVTMEQAWQFGKSLLRGQRDGLRIAGTVLADKIREVI